MRLIISEKNIGYLASLFIKDRMKSAADSLDKGSGGGAKNKNFVLGLPTGGTAIDMYKNLIALYEKKEISFKNAATFNLDEYIGLPENHKESYHSFMRENFFKHVDIEADNINIPNGNVADPIKEGQLYEEKIKKAGGIDLLVCGLGENGHIAFNEPYSSLDSYTRDKQLDISTIIANSRFFDNDIKKVPKTALTMGIKTMLEAREVLLLVSGEKKSFALKQLVEGSVSQKWPATALQLHRKLVVITDEAACNELTVGTYRYFKRLKDEFSELENTAP
ncbi:MAG: glucosamine-6-phosphate deaminase [Elusimicrobiota bacterium]|jgi:glucosamine-6-phosphate deaminase|nr:glucosamine-6-phosphate deaminase [Elusimicrobiota bacterium]